MNVIFLESNNEAIEVKSPEWIPTSVSSEVDDKFGDPQVVPRVGDQYQARIPSLIPASDLSQLTKKLMESKISAHLPESFSLGLPIPLIWAYCELESYGGILESVNNEESQVISENKTVKPKVEPLITSLGERKNVEGFQNSPSAFDSFPLPKSELNQVREMYLLPGSLGEPWNDIEYNSFLLGLYIFGKNLNLVKRFVGSKNMGDILSFYYGKFYRSERYRRWSECRKLRTRRCIYGQKIFKRWRQQELLSRLFSGISEECQNMLIVLSRAFGEGKVPFEEYVFALRDAVGVDMLINAVSIGKGKQDLTGNAVEPTKTNHIFSVRRPEIPIGKACSSLSSADIIKFLTGNFRLSKARSNDLFWEAVWPRLLAKGWHSEQPKDYAGFGSKQSLVFLIPGVKKFSRRRLVKGNHYFDSVSDVLNKVASEPELIKIEVPASEGSANGEDRQDKQGPDGVLPKQQHCYLQPRTSNCSQNKMKFTIVDTSMVNGLEQRKVRELRSLPSETMSTLTPSSHSSESEQDTSEDSKDEAEKTNTSNPVEESSDKGMSINSSDCTHIPEALNATKVEVKNNKCHFDMLNDEHPGKTNKHQFIQKVKSGCSQDFSPIMKKHKFMACNGEESCQLTESASMERKLDLNELASPSNEGSAIDNQEGGEELSAEKPETRMLIDLNLPLIEPETEMDRPQQNNDDQCANISSFSFDEIKFNEIDEFPDDRIEQQSRNVSCRQSSGNRPLTAKALEALEYSFLNSKKRKNVESSQNSSNSQSLFLSGRPTVSATCDNGADNVMTDTRAGEENLIPAYSNRMINLNSEPDYNF